jgi:hypothetical protein
VIRVVDELEPIAQVLMEGGYDVDSLEIPELGSCLLAETPYALVLCIKSDWERLLSDVEDAQAELTNLAAPHPSPRSWDLYVVARIDQYANEAQELHRERVEHDTRFARKFVLVGRDANADSIARALRPLLPLRSTPSINGEDQMAALRVALLDQQIEADLVSAALRSFRETGKIEVP